MGEEVNLFKRILTEDYCKRIAVIENAFGEKGMDHWVLARDAAG